MMWLVCGALTQLVSEIRYLFIHHTDAGRSSLRKELSAQWPVVRRNLFMQSLSMLATIVRNCQKCVNYNGCLKCLAFAEFISAAVTNTFSQMLPKFLGTASDNSSH